jgi:hypothetical protein
MSFEEIIRDDVEHIYIHQELVQSDTNKLGSSLSGWEFTDQPSDCQLPKKDWSMELPSVRVCAYTTST